VSPIFRGPDRAKSPPSENTLYHNDAGLITCRCSNSWTGACGPVQARVLPLLVLIGTSVASGGRSRAVHRKELANQRFCGADECTKRWLVPRFSWLSNHNQNRLAATVIWCAGDSDHLICVVFARFHRNGRMIVPLAHVVPPFSLSPEFRK